MKLPPSPISLPLPLSPLPFFSLSMETRNACRRRTTTTTTIMSNSFAATIAVVVLLIVSLLASPASAVPLSRSLLRSPRIVIPDHSAQVGFRFWGEEKGGRKLLSRVHTDDYGGTGANDKHDPSTGSR